MRIAREIYHGRAPLPSRSEAGYRLASGESGSGIVPVRLRHALGIGIVAILAIGSLGFAQTSAPTNSLPNPYRSIENWGTLPDGRTWGSTSAVAKDGSVTAFIPDPVETIKGTSAAEGVAADAAGNIYGAEVGPKRVMKYVKK
jgi:hypothetical protein